MLFLSVFVRYVADLKTLYFIIFVNKKIGIPLNINHGKS
jgi:hypothetical protein